MDSISHIIIGAVTGEIVAGSKFGKKALLWGGIIATLPDIDVVAQPFLSPAESLLFHRGPTHSVAFCILFAFALAKLLVFIHKKTKDKFGIWLKISAWCLFSHIFIDCFNSYGTAVFYPFSNFRVAFDSVGIVDIFLILPLLAALICFIFMKQQKALRNIIAVFAMSLSIVYLGFTISNKILLEKKVDQFFSHHSISYDRILTSPLPLTNFVWLVIVENEDGFFAAHYSKKNQEIICEKYFLKNHYLADSFKDNAEFKQLVRFSKGYYCLDQNSKNEIIFYDLRFASFDFDGTADLDKAVFTHKLKTNSSGKLIIEHNYPKRTVNWEKLKRYYNQITKDKFY